MGGDMGRPGTPWEGTTGILRKGTWGPGDPVGGDTELLWDPIRGDKWDTMGGDNWDTKGGDTELLWLRMMGSYWR